MAIILEAPGADIRGKYRGLHTAAAFMTSKIDAETWDAVVIKLGFSRDGKGSIALTNPVSLPRWQPSYHSLATPCSMLSPKSLFFLPFTFPES